MSFSKAKFTILEGNNKLKDILLQFNPSHYSFEESNEFGEKKLMGLKGNVHQFTGSKISDLKLDLMFDSTSLGGDVRDLIKPLDMIVNMDSDLHTPPACSFLWGSFRYDGIVSSIKKDFTYFYHDGIPARVKIVLTLKHYQNIDTMKAKLDLHSSDISKERILDESDSLFLMAHREYKSTSSWREIAKANDIDNPLKIKSGTSLLLPPKEKQ